MGNAHGKGRYKDRDYSKEVRDIEEAVEREKLAQERSDFLAAQRLFEDYVSDMDVAVERERLAQVRSDLLAAQRLFEEIERMDQVSFVRNTLTTERIQEILHSRYPVLNPQIRRLNGKTVIEFDVASTGYCGMYAMFLSLIVVSDEFRTFINSICGDDFKCISLIGFVSILLEGYELPDEIIVDSGLVEISNIHVDFKNIQEKNEYVGALNQDTLEIIAELLNIKLNISICDEFFHYRNNSKANGKLEANIGLSGGHYRALLSLDDAMRLIEQEGGIVDTFYKTHNDEQAKILRTQHY